MTMPPPREVLVTGAGGLIGRGVVRALLARGIRVRALRRDDGGTEASPLLTVFKGDLRDAAAMREAVRGVSHVIHLAARKSDEPDSDAVNVDGTRNLATAAAAEGVALFVHVSTPSAGLRSPGTYGATKARSEEVVRASGVPFVIVRPSVVYADAASGILGSMMGFLALPVVPMIGDGSVRFAPIFRDDLAALLVRLLDAPGAVGGCFDVGGPEVLSFRRMLETCMEAAGVRKKILALPVPLARLIAASTAWMPKPPVTRSNVRGAVEEVPLELAPLRAIVPYDARTFGQGVREILAAKPLEPLADTDAHRREAESLLAYVLRGIGCREAPSDAECQRFLDACRVHGVDASRVLPVRVLRSSFLLSGLDLLTRLRRPACAFQQKLLIAAAVAETSPRSAPFLLPRNRSLLTVIAGGIAAGCRTALAACAALFLLIAVRRWKIYAG